MADVVADQCTWSSDANDEPPQLDCFVDDDDSSNGDHSEGEGEENGDSDHLLLFPQIEMIEDQSEEDDSSDGEIETSFVDEFNDTTHTNGSVEFDSSEVIFSGCDTIYSASCGDITLTRVISPTSSKKRGGTGKETEPHISILMHSVDDYKGNRVRDETGSEPDEDGSATALNDMLWSSLDEQKQATEASSQMNSELVARRVHTCTVCQKRFRDSWKLKRHFKIHLRPIKIKQIKSEAVSDQLDFQIQESSTTDEISFQDFQFVVASNTASNDSNMNSESERLELNNDMVSRKQLERPSRSKYVQARNKECKVCGKKFPTNWKLQRHEAAHDRTRLMTRERDNSEKQEKIIERAYSSVGFTLPKDDSRESLLNSTTCQICQAELDNLINLERHIKTHQTAKHKCGLCDETFVRRVGLEEHTLTIHGKNGYECYMCDKTFTYEINLEHHMMIHNNIRPYACPEQNCGKCFTDHRSLQKHRRTHGEKSFTCPICPKRFYSMNGLRTHAQTHMISPYECTNCGVICGDQRSLEEHLQSHNEFLSGMMPVF